jgi:hypothetical protein
MANSTLFCPTDPKAVHRASERTPSTKEDVRDCEFGADLATMLGSDQPQSDFRSQPWVRRISTGKGLDGYGYPYGVLYT